MTAPDQACLVNCGLRGDECACWRANNPPMLYGAMPRQDLRVTPDTITLPLAEVEALMEAVDALDDEYCGQNWGQKLDTIEDLRNTLATLQERMK